MVDDHPLLMKNRPCNIVLQVFRLSRISHSANCTHFEPAYISQLQNGAFLRSPGYLAGPRLAVIGAGHANK